MTIRLLLCAWCLLLFASCEKGSDPMGEVDSINLSVGSAWTYRWHLAEYSSSGELLWDTSGTYIVAVVALNQTVGPYQGLTLLEARERDVPAGTSAIWYAQTSDRLTEVAYRSSANTPLVFPKGASARTARSAVSLRLSPFAEPLAIQARLGGSGILDSIQLRDDPRVVYLYPMNEGTSWVAFSSPFLQERTVEAYEEVSVQGGLYRCARVRTRIPNLAPGLRWMDYVSSEGLVKRTFDSWVQAVGEAGPGGATDSVRVLEELELLAH